MKIKKIASVILAVSLICMSINIDTNSFTKAETVSFTDIVSKLDTSAVFKEKDLTYTWDKSSATTIKLDDANTEIIGSGASFNSGVVTITDEGIYVISGSLSDGRLIIDALDTAKIYIVFNGVEITSSSDAPFSVLSADKVYLTLEQGTENTLVDAQTRAGDTTATLDSSADITINGLGALNVKGNHKKGIHSSDDLKICGATISVDTTSAVNAGHALSGNDLIAIRDARIELNSSNDGMQSDNTNVGKGNIIIENSEVKVVSNGDGLQAENSIQITGGRFDITTTVDGDGMKAGETIYIDGEPDFTINSAADGIKTDFLYDTTLLTDNGNIQIKNGNFTIKAGDDAIVASAETADKIEKNASLLIYDGEFDITSTGDGIKASKEIQIADGNFKIISASDAIQAENASDATVGAVSILNGEFILNSVGDGIQGTAVVNIYGGSFTIKTTGVSSTTSCKGLKATGTLTINGGNFNITSTDDSVHSDNAVVINNCDALNISSSDDGIHADNSVTINGGNIDITKSYEGIEGASITLNGGNIKVTASDDGINASDGTGSSMGGGVRPFADVTQYATGVSFTINGGYIVVNASGDGLDSNGTFAVTGGTTIVYGPNSGGNGIFDYDGSAALSGGTLVAIGTGDMAQNFSSAQNQCSIMLKLNSNRNANTTFAVCDSNDNSILAITAKKTTGCIIVTSPEIKSGSAYTFKTGGSVVNGVDGFAQGEDCYVGGTTLVTTTPTSNVWSINESGTQTGNNGGMGGGTRPGSGTRPSRPPKNTQIPTVPPTIAPTPVMTATPTLELTPTPVVTLTPTAVPTLIPTQTPNLTATPGISDEKIKVTAESEYIVDRENGAIENVPEKTSIEDFLGNISSTVLVFNAAGNLIEDTDSDVKTGDKIVLSDSEGNKLDELTIVISGDLNCDGNVNSRDIALIQRHILADDEMTKYVAMAADMSKDDKINSKDIAALQRKIINF